MITKLTKQERLYDVTQLAKAIFVESAQSICFITLSSEQKEILINNAFIAAETFLNYQEKRATDV